MGVLILRRTLTTLTAAPGVHGAIGKRGGSAYSPLHIHRRSHSFVKAIRQICCSDDQDQFGDLIFVEILSESVKIGFLRRPWPARQRFRKLNSGSFLFVEDIASSAARLFERLNLLFAHAVPLRRSGMSATSILTSVHQRGFEIGQFLDFG